MLSQVSQHWGGTGEKKKIEVWM